MTHALAIAIDPDPDRQFLVARSVSGGDDGAMCCPTVAGLYRVVELSLREAHEADAPLFVVVEKKGRRSTHAEWSVLDQVRGMAELALDKIPPTLPLEAHSGIVIQVQNAPTHVRIGLARIAEALKDFRPPFPLVAEARLQAFAKWAAENYYDED